MAELDKTGLNATTENVKSILCMEERGEDAAIIAHGVVTAYLSSTSAGVTEEQTPRVTCQHEPFEGRCVHCNVRFVDGRALEASRVDAPSGYVACIACEGSPKAPNDPCGLCGTAASRIAPVSQKEAAPVDCSRENISEGLASRLIERMKLKYLSNCKCGNCHLVPLDLISETAAFVCQSSPAPAGEPAVKALEIPVGWYLVPEVPTEEQMSAGLYQASHDAEYADVCQSYMDMVRAGPTPPVLVHPTSTPVSAPLVPARKGGDL